MSPSLTHPIHASAPEARPSDERLAATVHMVHTYSMPIVRELPIPPAANDGTW